MSKLSNDEIRSRANTNRAIAQAQKTYAMQTNGSPRRTQHFHTLPFRAGLLFRHIVDQFRYNHAVHLEKKAQRRADGTPKKHHFVRDAVFVLICVVIAGFMEAMLSAHDNSQPQQQPARPQASRRVHHMFTGKYDQYSNGEDPHGNPDPSYNGDN